MSEYQRILRLVLFSGVFIISAVASAYHGQFNSVRIVYLPFTEVQDPLVNRIKNSNYNYAAIPFPFRVSNDSVGDGDVYANLRADVCNFIIALYRQNIRLIPIIPMSSRWALQWKILQMYENPAIGMNTITSNEDLPDIIGENPICRFKDSTGTVTHGSNSWAPEPDGVDKSIIDIFSAIRDGFSDANVDYPLEYVHIQHDEPQFLNWLLMAGVGKECGNTLPYRGNLARGEVSAADVSFISSRLSEGYPLAKSYQILLANELYRRVIQAEEVFGADVKLLFYAESFDDQSWGGVPWHVTFGDKTTILMHDVITLPGLDDEQKKIVKKQLYPVLWNYDGKNPFVDNILEWLYRADYDSEAAFKRFASNGYRFLYVGALQNGNDSRQQIIEYAIAADSFRDNCLGYLAATWAVGYDPAAPDKKWDIIEYMPSVQSSTGIKKKRNLLNQTRYPVITINNSRNGCVSAFSIQKETRVTIAIYTSSGRLVKNLLKQSLTPGKYVLHWQLQPGLYLISVQLGPKRSLEKISVIY